MKPKSRISQIDPRLILLDSFGAKGPSDAIVRSEKRGQQQLVESSQIPAEGIDNPAFGKTDKDTITPRRMIEKYGGKVIGPTPGDTL
jgi:hypothetical protein